jgi:hypothetical protein
MNPLHRESDYNFCMHRISIRHIPIDPLFDIKIIYKTLVALNEKAVRGASAEAVRSKRTPSQRAAVSRRVQARITNPQAALSNEMSPASAPAERCISEDFVNLYSASARTLDIK